MKEININSLVKVKLNEEGKNILESFYIDRWVNKFSFTLEEALEKMPKPKEDGNYILPLIEFMRIFGSYIDYDHSLPFESNILFYPWDVIDKDEDKSPRTRRGN